MSGEAIEPISDDELQRLQELDTRMTAAPWEFESIPGKEAERLVHVADDDPNLEPETIDVLFGQESEVEENWSGIRKLRNSLPGLLTRLDAAESRAAEATAERDELQATFALQHQADMRAIKSWQEAHPDQKNIWPDRCNMVSWLMGRMDELRKVIDSSDEVWRVLDENGTEIDIRHVVAATDPDKPARAELCKLISVDKLEQVSC